MAPTSTPSATITVKAEDQKSPKEQPSKKDDSKKNSKDPNPLSKKEQLKQEQEKNAEELHVILKGIKTITQEALETVEGELKDRKLSKDYRQAVNKWLRDANAELAKQTQKSDQKPKKETRGKKAKKVTMNQIRNGVKESIIKVQKYADQQIEQRKSVRRILNAKNLLQRLLKYQLTE